MQYNAAFVLAAQRSYSSTELIMSNYLIAVTLISQIVAFPFFRKKIKQIIF